MIKHLILIALTSALMACGSGGGGASAPKTSSYIPSGNFLLEMNLSQCFKPLSLKKSVKSDGQGKVCDDSGDCININLANNPCLVKNLTESGVSADLKFKDCSYQNSKFTSIMTVEITQPGTGAAVHCDGNAVMTPN